MARQELKRENEDGRDSKVFVEQILRSMIRMYSIALSGTYQRGKKKGRIVGYLWLRFKQVFMQFQVLTLLLNSTYS